MLVYAALVAFVGGCSSSPEGAAERPPPAESPSPEVEAPPEMLPHEKEAARAAAEQAEKVSDEDLQVFARGVRAVADREQQLKEQGRDLETRRQEATSAADVMVAEREALQQMKGAVESEGIDFEAFMKMGQFIRQQPTLLERLGEFLDDEEIEAFYGGT